MTTAAAAHSTSYRDDILARGYCIVKGLFPKDLLQACREDILAFKAKEHLIANEGGYTIPDFIQWPALVRVAELRNYPSLLSILQNNIFDGKPFRFCAHNDIGINRIVGWHKDRLNGAYSKYQTTPIWSKQGEEQHEIMKVLIYLEDHPGGKDGLTVVPASHLRQDMGGTEAAISIESELGDVVIFDQRITHRGMARQVAESRILVSFGFGKENVFTDEFERGTVARQKDQNLTR